MKFKKTKKFEQLVQTATDLFKQYGIRRVSIEEICRTANVSKMTFYKYFKQKNDIVKYILERMFEDAEKEYHEIMNQGIPYPEKVKQIIKMKLNYNRGMSKQFLAEFLEMAEPELKELVQKKTIRNFKILMDDFIESQKKGEIRKDIQPEFLNFILNHLLNLTLDPKLQAIFATSEALVSELTNFFFYGILPHETPESNDEVPPV